MIKRLKYTVDELSLCLFWFDFDGLSLSVTEGKGRGEYILASELAANKLLWGTLCNKFFSYLLGLNLSYNNT